MSKRNLLLLFDRPLETVIVPKGPNQEAFDVPVDLLVNIVLFKINSSFYKFSKSRVIVTNRLGWRYRIVSARKLRRRFR